MGVLKLKFAMYTTLAIIIGVSTLIVAAIMLLAGITNILAIMAMIILVNLIQWLMAPYIIEALYGVREASPLTYGWLHEMVERLSAKSGISKPKVMIAEIDIPNAFAYGSPLTGNRIAVTRGLLNTLKRGEIEAVLGHEIGHLVHKDVQIMMLASLLPALLYYIGYIFVYGIRSDREEAGVLALIGILSIIASFILNLFVLGLSRLREYYADRHSALIVEDGPRKLQLALAKIVAYTSKAVSLGVNVHSYSSFRHLLIADPSSALRDYEQLREYYGEYSLVERIKRRKLTFWDNLIELFSTHPNMVKRMRALDEIARELGYT